MPSPAILRVLGPVLGGAVAGLAVTGFWGWRSSQPKPPAAPASSEIPAAAAPRFDDRAFEARRIAQLEARVAELSASPSASAAAGAPSPDRSPIFDREMRGQQVLAEHARLLGQHDAEPRDAAWAPRQERELQAKLSELASSMKSFSFRSVECRTASCVAKLEWPSEGAARADLRGLLEQSSNLQCAREIAFPPASGGGAYEASMVIDCTEVRWGDVQGAPPGRTEPR